MKRDQINRFHPCTCLLRRNFVKNCHRPPTSIDCRLFPPATLFLSTFAFECQRRRDIVSCVDPMHSQSALVPNRCMEARGTRENSPPTLFSYEPHQIRGSKLRTICSNFSLSLSLPYAACFCFSSVTCVCNARLRHAGLASIALA